MKRSRFCHLIILGLVIMHGSGCMKYSGSNPYGGNAPNHFPPDVRTMEATDITDTSAYCCGEIVVVTGSSMPIAVGFCWSREFPQPDTSNAHLGESSSKTYFGFTLTGLRPHTMYYYRAFAMNVHGIGYGDVRYFYTR